MKSFTGFIKSIVLLLELMSLFVPDLFESGQLVLMYGRSGLPSHYCSASLANWQLSYDHLQPMR